MKKYTTQIVVGIVVVAIFVVYIVSQKGSSSSVASDQTTSTTSTTPAASSTPSSSPSSAPKYKDGTYTGSVANAYFGNLQVQATIQNGMISDVQLLQYPNANSNSIRINTGAIVTLRSEAIVAQDAQVDVVSGATQSSGAFVQSLTSALAQAKVTQG